MTDLATDKVLALLAKDHAELLGFVTKRVGDRAAAEDILQEAAKRGLEHAGDLRDDSSVRAWFYQILRNAIADEHRRRGRAARAAEQPGLAAEVDPELASNVCKCVAQLKDTLKPEYAAAITRIEVDEVSVKDYAAESGISSGAAAVRVFRARAALRKQVARACGACAEHGCFDCNCGPDALRNRETTEDPADVGGAR